MKKLLTVFLALIAALCGMLVIAACDEKAPDPAPSETHVHQWGEWTSDQKGNHTRVCKLDETHVETEKCEKSMESAVTAPTCDDGGYTTHTCTVCRYSYQDSTTPKLGHDYEYTFDEATHTHSAVCKHDNTHILSATDCSFDGGVETLAPTCETDGAKTFTCEVCNGSYKETIEKLDHDWQYTFDPQSHTHSAVCKHDKLHVLSATDCSFDGGVETLAPTCETDGAKSFTCKICKGSYEEKIEKTDHDWRYTFDPQTQTHSAVCHYNPAHTLQSQPCDLTNGLETKPTCTENGYTTYICKTCLGNFTTFDEETQKATGHSYPAEWLQMEGGKHYHTCVHPDCEERQEETCEFLEEVVTAPTCLEQGYTTKTCPDCGASKIENYQDALNHDYTNAEYHSNHDGTHYRVCTRENCGEREVSECSDFTKTSKPATCTENGTETKKCNVCNYETVTETETAKGHDFKNYIYELKDGKHMHTGSCANCEETETKECVFSSEQVIKNATCTKQGSETDVCTICQHEETKTLPALGHNFEGAQYISDKNGSHYRVCTRNCDEEGATEKKQACTMVEGTSIPNSCTEAGSTASKRCPDCGYTEDGDVIPANGHTWQTKTNDGWTPGTNGKHFRVCTKCNTREEMDCQYTMQETPAECAKEGKRVKTCSVCKNALTEVLPRLGHNLTSYTFKSETDSDNIQHHFHVGHCDRCKEEVREACELQISQTTLATCTTDGTTTYTCFRCGHVHTYVTESAKGHSPTGGFKFDPETHTHSGSCGRCGIAIDPTPCTPDSQKTKVQKQTCLVGGYTEQTCSVCGNRWKENVTDSLGGHKWVADQNSYNKQYNQHSLHCDNPGCIATKLETCSYKEETVQATCTADGYTRTYCTACLGVQSETIVHTNGHDYVYQYTGDKDNTHTHRITCRNCNLDENVECTLKPLTTVATCTQGGDNDLICEDCQHVLDRDDSGALGHEFEYTYLYGDYHRCTCTRCHFTKTVRCTIDQTFEEGNCITPTIRTSTCRECRNQTKSSIVKPTGHQWSQWTVKENTNEHVRSCQNCALQETRGGHDFSKSNFCDCGFDGLLYELSGNSYYIVKRSENLVNTERIVIPSVHDGKNVEEIGAHAFRGFDKLKEIVIPTTVKRIGSNGLNTCTSLHRVTIGDVDENGDIKEDSSSSQLTSIEEYAFQGDRALTTFDLPNSLTNVGAYAFENCEKYENFTIGADVSEIGKGAFNGTLKVKNAKLDGDALYLGKHLIGVKKTHEGNFEIKSGTLSVAESAFEDCTKLTTLTIFAGVKQFDKNAFKGCTGLTKVTFKKPDDQSDVDLVKAWFEIMFENDAASPLNFTHEFHIDGVDGNITIPEGAKTIPIGTFRGDSITSISIPETVTSIGAGAFYGCTSLTSITIPASVTSIGAYAFYGCTSLSDIQFGKPTAPAERKEAYYIGENAFAGTGYYLSAEKWDENGLLYIGNHLIKANSGKTAARAAVAGAPSDLEKMTKIPENVATVKNEITLKADTITISARAFENCVDLKKITIGEKVEFIGIYAFRDAGLTEAVIQGTANFLAWRFRPDDPDSTEPWIARSVNPNPNGDNTNYMATLLKTTYQGEWSRLATAKA